MAPQGHSSFEALGKISKPRKPQDMNLLGPEPSPSCLLPGSGTGSPNLQDEYLLGSPLGCDTGGNTSGSASHALQDVFVPHPSFNSAAEFHLDLEGCTRRSYFSTGVNLEVLGHGDVPPNRHLHDYHAARMNKFLETITAAFDAAITTTSANNNNNNNIFIDSQRESPRLL
ncbi:hypothetical protein AK812_SmicGene14276 [Symbiodinium microadriaticum]|uniref:Uncharacterized protein n=1 Tax=Symbiodinium microadriaticum TaxID=2951 RepID=A0A1Q9E5Z0_SYMMI|nr:hypothetical protein AK812_SmicGene14276 [Symbiodinium microadriaticum]